MKMLLCWLLGHRWRGLTKDEIRACLDARQILMAKCERCGEMR